MESYLRVPAVDLAAALKAASLNFQRWIPASVGGLSFFNTAINEQSMAFRFHHT